jgi:PAS domain S-box-containing protein
VGNFDGVYVLPDYQLNLRNDQQRFVKVEHAEVGCFDFISLGDILLAACQVGLYQVIGQQAQLIHSPSNPAYFCLSKKFPTHVFASTWEEGLVAFELLGKNSSLSNQNTFNSSHWIDAKLIKLYKYNNTKAYIRKPVSDDEGNLWLSTDDYGLLYLKFKSSRINDFEITHYDTSQGLPAVSQNYVQIIDSQVLASTQKGIYRLIRPQENLSTPAHWRFVPDKEIGAIFQTNPRPVYHLKRDQKNNYWMSFRDSSLGIAQRNDNGIYFLNDLPFRKIKGIIESFRVEKDGVAWLCGVESRSLFRYDSNIKKDYRVPYPALIRQVTSENGDILFGGNNPENSLGAGQIAKLVLPYQNNSLIFRYAATCYESAEDLRFQYLLVGYDPDWSSWVTKNEKEYTNLAQGHYCFQVKAKNLYDHESQVASFAFRVKPPWAQTIWAYIGYIGFSLFLMWAVVRLNGQRLKANQLRLEKIIRERTVQLVKRNKQIEKQKEELKQKKDEVEEQKDLLEDAYQQLYSVNRKLENTNRELEITNQELERTNIEQERINQELEKLSIVASHTDNAVIIMDAEGNIEWINEGYTHMYGFTLKELTETKGKNLCQISADPNTSHHIEQCLSEQKSIIYEILTKTKTNKDIWAQTTLTPIMNHEGKVYKIVAIDSDISLIKEASERIEGIVKSVADALLVTGIHHQVILMNPAAEDLFGIRFAELMNRHIDSLLLNDLLKTMIKDTLSLKQSSFEFDVHMIKMDKGAALILRAVTSVIRDQMGRAAGVVTILHDVTKDREISQQKSDFLSMSAHELKSPLTAVRGFAELLLDRPELKEAEKKKFLENIVHQSISLTNLINDLLDLSKIESGVGFALNKTPIKIGKVINRIFSQFQLAKKNHTFNLCLPKPDIQLIADPDKITRILQNILSNAVKYSPKGGEIIITGQIQTGFYQISIQDQGLGMTPQHLAHIFEKFYRADASQEEIEGTGLGMTIVKQLVEMHGGKIWIKSTFGQGTTVYFTLPLGK